MKKISRTILLTVFGVSLAAPFLAVAAGINTALIKSQYSDPFISVINTILVPVLMAIALIVFLWGIFKYFIYGAANESEKAEGRWFALWGIIGFVIIVSLWGLVNLVMGTLGLSAGGTAPTPPTFNSSSNTSAPPSTVTCPDGSVVPNVSYCTPT